MSIKSLFENIADAIKDKNPNITNVTPVEMPSAIRSIPSGSSTAGGVAYDNTASGLTASNVQDAIDELSGDLSTINSDLSELKAPISSHDSVVTLTTNSYTAQKDGYIQMYAGASSSILVQLFVDGDAIMLVGAYGGSANPNYNGMFVRKGTAMLVYSTVGTASAIFVPVS